MNEWKVEQLTNLKNLLVDYVLTLNKAMETRDDYQSFKPVTKQIYLMEDLIDAMIDVLNGKEVKTE
jgi:hypothetical protein